MDATSVGLASGGDRCRSVERMVGDAQQPLPGMPVAVTASAQEVTCEQCAGRFACGATAASCWCQSVPPLDLSRLPAGLTGGCLCPSCLRAAVTAQALN